MNASHETAGCPRCGAGKLKPWHDLTEDEKFLVERALGIRASSPNARKEHRFCPRCLFEERRETDRLA